MICSIKRLRAEINGSALFDLTGIDVRGRCCTIYGPSGIGKSTFLRGLASGLDEKPFKGVTFKKLIDFDKSISYIRYIPQHPPRFDFTVETFFHRILKSNPNCIGCSDTLKWICDAFELNSLKNQKMTSISGGQLHRVHLAIALASNAELLLLDEPTAALDARNTEILMQLLTEFTKERNGFIVCCSHDLHFLRNSRQDSMWNAVDFPSFTSVQDATNANLSTIS